MFKVLKTFSGIISAVKGNTIEIENQEIAQDLLDAGYIEEVSTKPKKETTKKNEEKTAE